jgi:hypothetical protein
MTSDSERGATPQLREYLDELAEDPPKPETSFVPAVMRSARWQSTARPYLLYVGRLLSAIGIALTLRDKRGKPR